MKKRGELFEETKQMLNHRTSYEAAQSLLQSKLPNSLPQNIQITTTTNTPSVSERKGFRQVKVEVLEHSIKTEPIWEPEWEQEWKPEFSRRVTRSMTQKLRDQKVGSIYKGELNMIYFSHWLTLKLRSKMIRKQKKLQQRKLQWRTRRIEITARLWKGLRLILWLSCRCWNTKKVKTRLVWKRNSDLVFFPNSNVLILFLPLLKYPFEKNTLLATTKRPVARFLGYSPLVCMFPLYKYQLSPSPWKLLALLHP